MAAQFAQRMLPQIFRQDDPVLQVALPPEVTQQLQQLVVGLDAAVFHAGDALGWTYQFWQSAEKDAVNARVKSGEKISGETLPAVTQLFTEPYMVQFLLHNTLGAWHAGKVLAARPELAQSAQNEAELRAAVALPGYSFDYLRFVREADDKPWRPAAGTFDGWPRTAKEIRMLDPCCGSGHFLVAGFELLSALRQHEEALSLAEAAEAVLRDNLFGLELDARCVQIAAFALAMAAWRQSAEVVALPPLHVACCGVGPSGTKEQWLKLAEKAAAQGGMPVKRGLYEKEESLLSVPLRNALEDLYLQFQKAPELGSLIDPKRTAGSMYQADFAQIEPLFARVLESEAVGEDAQEQAVAAQGMAKAAGILGQTFTLVATNVPYLGRGAQGEVLKEFAEQHYPDAKADLATVFVQRSFGWLGKAGTVAVVTPQNWLFLTSYRKLRQKLLIERAWNVVVKLGPAAFRDMNWWAANTGMLVLSAGRATEDSLLAGVDASSSKMVEVKAALLRGEMTEAIGDSQGDPEFTGESAAEPREEGGDVFEGDADGSVIIVPQEQQLMNPDARLSFSSACDSPLLSEYARAYQGIATADYPLFGRCYWEVVMRGDGLWSCQHSTVLEAQHFGGDEHVLCWERGVGRLARSVSARIQGLEALSRDGIAVSQMGSLPVSRYLGHLYDNNTSALVPADPAHLPAVWSFCLSPEFAKAVRRIDQALKVTNASLVKVPFDLGRWQRIAAEQYPLGLPEPQTNYPTQWLFHGHPAGMTATGGADASPLGVPDPSVPQHPSLLCRTPNLADVLQVATARLLGYRWPAEIDADMRLDAVQRAWATRSEELLPFADEDGIVCLNPVRGESSAADRLRELLRAAFGSHWQPDTERKLLAAAAGDDKAPESLDAWLRDDFFAAHCKLFHDRPFVWHLWDGKKDGFHALVNYHKLAGPNGEGRRTLELLTFTYLNDWIERQRADVKAGEAGAEARLAAATELQEELKKILNGEPPYDLFVRWKPLHEQPLGWDPDINDGVRLNIRPFVLAKDVKGKGAGILRSKVKVKWTKDRGKEPEKLRPRELFPWFWSCDPELPAHQRDYRAPKTAAFDGVRWNDLHYSRAVKEEARRLRQQGGAP